MAQPQDRDIESSALEIKTVEAKETSKPVKSDLLVGGIELVVESPALDQASIPREVEIIQTTFGPIHVTVEGNRQHPPLITYHEFGTNHKICFQSFLNYPGVRKIFEKFSVYHIDAPGHEDDASDIGSAYTYPTFENLSQQVFEVTSKLGLKKAVLLGVGLGASILSLFACDHPELVRGMILISGSAGQATWTEYGWNWAEDYWLRFWGNTMTFQNALIRGYLSTNAFYYNTDLLQMLTSEMNRIPSGNVNKLIQTFGKRTSFSEKLRSLNIPAIIFAGAEAYNLDETVEMFSYFQPGLATWIKVDDCGTLVLLEAPAALVKPLELWFMTL